MKCLICAGLAAMLASCTTAQTVPPVTIAKAIEPSDLAMLAASEPDLVEAYGNATQRQRGQLRLPEGEGPFPVAMLVHGGCFQAFGSPNGLGPMADWLAENGVASWNIGYREIGTGGEWPNLFRDWAKALAHIDSLAERYPLDRQRISVIGHSAGALAATWLSMDDPARHIGIADLPKVHATVILDAPLEFAHFARNSEGTCSAPILAPLMGGDPDAASANYAMLDPLFMGADASRMLYVAGVEPVPSREVLAALGRNGTQVKTVSLAEKRHFDMIVPGTADFAQVAPAILATVRGDLG